MPKELRDLSEWVLSHGSQRGRVPIQMRAGRSSTEGSVGGVGPNWMKM